MMKQCKSISGAAMTLSVASLVLAGLVFFAGMDQILGLAGTQWILIAIVLAVYAVYFSDCTCDVDKK